VKTLGIDLSAGTANTAACEIDWTAGAVSLLDRPTTDEQIALLPPGSPRRSAASWRGVAQIARAGRATVLEPQEPLAIQSIAVRSLGSTDNFQRYFTPAHLAT
jgi:hypothetical protein